MAYIPLTQISSLDIATIAGAPVQTVADGVQLVALSNSLGEPIDAGTNSLPVNITNPNPIITTSGIKDKIYTLSAFNNAVFQDIDCSLYSTAFVQVSGVFSMFVAWEGSNDLSTWSTIQVVQNANGFIFSQASSLTVGQFEVPIKSKYIRVRCNLFASGVATFNIRFSGIPQQQNIVSMGNLGSITDGAFNTVINARDGTGGTGKLAVVNTVVNAGGLLDHQKEVTPTTNSVGTGIVAVGILAQFDDVSPTTITENQFGNMRMSANRNLYTTLRDASGKEVGLAINNNGELSNSDSDARNTLSDIRDGIQGLNDLISSINPIIPFASDSTQNRMVNVPGTTVDKIRVAKEIIITASTTETTLTSGVPNQKLNLREITITNTSATACSVALRDRTAGSVIRTFMVPGTDTRGMTMGGAVIFPQTTAGDNWTVTCLTSVTDIRVGATFEIA